MGVFGCKNSTYSCFHIIRAFWKTSSYEWIPNFRKHLHFPMNFQEHLCVHSYTKEAGVLLQSLGGTSEEHGQVSRTSDQEGARAMGILPPPLLPV